MGTQGSDWHIPCNNIGVFDVTRTSRFFGFLSVNYIHLKSFISDVDQLTNHFICIKIEKLFMWIVQKHCKYI